MKKKKKTLLKKRTLSFILILSMLLSYIPEIPVHAAPLTFADTIENQAVFGFTYTENGKERNMYLYKSSDGKYKLTGDILFTTSTYGFYQVRHYDGYLELPLNADIKQAILIQHGHFYTEAHGGNAFMDLRILDTDGNLYSFNATPQEILTPLKTGVRKIDDVFYLDESDKLGMISPENSNNRGVTMPNGSYGYEYWNDTENLASNVSDFLIVAPNAENEHNYGAEHYFKVSENTHIYVKYNDETPPAVKKVYLNYSGEYSLVNSELAIPSIDASTNTLTINNFSKGIDENWVYLQTDKNCDIGLASEEPIVDNGSIKQYSVMDGHVIITLSDMNTNWYFTTLTVQTDSTETISYNSSTSTIKTGYNDIILYEPFHGGNIVYTNAVPLTSPDATENSNYGENWTDMYGQEHTSSVEYHIYNEQEGGGVGDKKYYYEASVKALGDHSDNTSGLCFTNYSQYTIGDEREIGEGLTSQWTPKTLKFTEERGGNVYNHIMNFEENRHYVFMNHHQYEEYPMNFKAGETDNVYKYSTDEWEVRVYAKHVDDCIWQPVFEFSYSDNYTPKYYAYPYFYTKFNSVSPVKQLTYDEDEYEYIKPNHSNDYNIFKNVDIEYIQFENTYIRGSSLLDEEDLEPGYTPVYDMTGGKCVYRATNFNNNDINYDVTEEGKLYCGSDGRQLLAENVVKVESSGKYLTTSGELFDVKGNKIKDNVINITDNLYQTADGKWKYISSDDEFKFDAADEHNLYVNHEYADDYTQIKYTFGYDENEITSVVDEKGKNVTNGDTRVYKKNGTHTFTLTNKYGDTYTKRILVTGFYSSDTTKAAISAVNGKVTLTGSEKSKIQYKKLSDEDWTDYEEPFAYDGPFLYKTTTERSGVSIIKAEIDEESGKLSVTDLSEGQLTPNDYYVNAVWDGNNMRYYDRGNNTFKLADNGMSEGSLKYIYTNYNLFGAGNDHATYVLTNEEPNGPEEYIKPIYGFIGPHLADDSFVPLKDNISYPNNYGKFVEEKSDGTDKVYMGSFTMLTGNSPSGTNISVKSEDVYGGDTKIEETLDGSHMLEFYNNSTNQNTTFIKAFMDGIYNWLVTDTGQLLRSKAEILAGNQGRVSYYDNFTLEEVANDVTDVDEDYIVTTASGDGKSFGYGKDTVKYYLNTEIMANGGIDGAAESGDIIIASSGEGMNKTALASNGNYYVAYDENNMICYDHVDPSVDQLDCEVSNTNWTNEFVTTKAKLGTSIDSAIPDGTSYKLIRIDGEDETCVEHIIDDPGNPGTSISVPEYNTGTDSTQIYNGSYRIDLINNTNGKTLASQNLIINNIDTVNPSVVIQDESNGQYTFAGQDKEGTFETEDDNLLIFDGAKSAVSGIENIYYSLDNTIDKASWNVLNKPVKYTPTGTETGSTDLLEVNNKTIYIYAKDNAGNISDTQAFNIGIDLTSTITYKNGETDLSFYANDDTNHDKPNYNYSYTIGDTTTDGYEKTFTEDTDVVIHGEYTITEESRTLKKDKDVPIIVLKPGTPTISDIDATTRSVTVTAGNTSHMTFKELWIKVDDGEYTKYTDQEKTITFTNYGYHTIKAYQVAENTELINGPYTFNGEEVQKKVEDPEPVSIRHSYKYEKGKTTVTFYANDDTNNDDDRWSYKYTVDGDTEKDGYTFYVTENTTADLFAEVNNGGLKSNNTKPIDIYVIDAEKPQIGDVPKNGDTSIITAGDIQNDTLAKLEYKIDDATELTTINSGDTINIPVGWHTVYAKQTTTGGIITENSRRLYVADLDITHKIRHYNGSTKLTFEDKKVDKNPDLTYTYDRDDDDKADIIGQGVVSYNPVTVLIKETDPLGNDDEDTVNLDIVKTQPPTVSVANDTMTLTAGDIENASLIKMYYSFNNNGIENFIPYEGPVQLDMKNVTVYTYQTVMPDNPGSDDDIVLSGIGQADIYKYDVEFVNKYGISIANGYSHVVLAGTSVTENAIDIPTYTAKDKSITDVINNTGKVIQFVYYGNPVDVIIYHRDSENADKIIETETLENTALETTIKASEHLKTFKGYKFKNAVPEEIVVSNDTKKLNIYYEYAEYNYVVHYVDENNKSIANDKVSAKKLKSKVTENAIEIPGYDLDDKNQKTITIKDDDTNEIWFTYKKHINPRSVSIAGNVTDEEKNPLSGKLVILKKKTNIIQLLSKAIKLNNAEDTVEAVTDEKGYYTISQIAAGDYTLSVYDAEDTEHINDDNLLATAEITVGKTGEETNDNITVKKTGERITTEQKIEADRFIFNVGKNPENSANVTIYYIDTENNNAVLDSEVIPNVEFGEKINCDDHKKEFAGYKFKNAEPEMLTVAKGATEMKLYYEYENYDYTVHYVDENKNPLAEDNNGKEKLNNKVTEEAIEIEGYHVTNDASQTITIKADDKNEIWFTYKLNPNTVVIHHLDAENNNKEISKDAIAGVEPQTSIKANDHIKNITGYKFKNADPEVLVATKDNKDINIYYTYADFNYTVHYVDENKNSLAADKNSNAKFNSVVTEKAINIDGYNLNDDAQKKITIKADKPNEIWFTYKKQTEPPVTVTVYHLDAENNNSELAKEELPNVAPGAVMNASGYVQKFTGYTLRNAEPEQLTVSKDNKEIRLYYEYDSFTYTIHYVDENGKTITDDKIGKAKYKSSITEKSIELKGYSPIDGDEKTIVIEANDNNEIWFKYEKIVENPPIFSMYKEIVLKDDNSFTINLQGIKKNAKVTSKITAKSKKAKSRVTIKQQKNGDVLITPKKVGKTQVTCTIIQNGAEYKVVVDIRVLKQYKGTSKNFDLKKNGLVKTSGELPEFNVYKRIVKGKNTKIKFTQVAENANVKFYVANKTEAKSLKIGKVRRKGKTATCTIVGKKKGWVHLTAKITQNGKTYYTRLLVRIDDRSDNKKEISKQIHKYLK